MKFVYFGYDFMLSAVLDLIEDGHELCGIYSFPCDNIFNFNMASRTLAQNLGVPFLLERADSAGMQGFIDQGCACFLSAGYPYKIPESPDPACYAVNVHPAYLPHARGIMPVPHIILNQAAEAAGLSAHKMTQIFDDGDILLQTKFDLSANETPESYMAKTLLAAGPLFKALFSNLPALWENAAPQDHAAASLYPPPRDSDRNLNWGDTVADIDRRARAFGRFGAIARIEGQKLYVFDHVAWQQTHEYAPGTLVANTHTSLTIAVKDGFICLTDLQEAPEA